MGLVSPTLQRRKHLFKFTRFEITSHGVLNFELLLLLIKFPPEDVEVDGVDDEIFEFADGGHVQCFQEIRVG